MTRRHQTCHFRKRSTSIRGSDIIYIYIYAYIHTYIHTYTYTYTDMGRDKETHYMFITYTCKFNHILYTIYIYIYVYIIYHNIAYSYRISTLVPAPMPCTRPCRESDFYILQRGVQWKQGVVMYMTLSTGLLYNTTPIHCTPLRLHPPLQSIQK